MEKIIAQNSPENKKAPGTTPGLKPNPLEPTHPFPMTWEGITILKPFT
jgi:hypothetical protein